MKKSIVVTTSSTIEDFKKTIKKVAGFGFDGAEFAVRNPKDLEIESIINIIKENNLEVPAIGTGQAYIKEGLSFTNPNESVRKMVVERIKTQVVFASNFNAQVIIGSIRGKIGESIDREEVEEWVVKSLRQCSNFAREYNVKLTLEPINRYKTNFINTVNQGIQFIERVGVSNLGLLVDTFHMNIEEASICDSIIQAKDYITHVHFADSNQWAPGCGHLDFKEIIKTLKKIDYRGYVSAEILPLPDPNSAIRITAETLKKLNIN